MKTSLLTLGILFLFATTSCSQDLRKLKESETDSKKVELAKEFANSFFTELKNGSFYQFGDNAIPELKNQMTEANQKALYGQLKDQFGEFVSVDYAETWIQGENKSVQIFRLKSEFNNTKNKLEIRVVLNESNKIAGFWIKPWSDMLQ